MKHQREERNGSEKGLNSERMAELRKFALREARHMKEYSLRGAIYGTLAGLAVLVIGESRNFHYEPVLHKVVRASLGLAVCGTAGYFIGRKNKFRPSESNDFMEILKDYGRYFNSEEGRNKRIFERNVGDVLWKKIKNYLGGSNDGPIA